MWIRDWAKAPVEVGRRLLEEWNEDRVAGLAAEVAFYAVLSLFPGLLAMAGFLGVLESVVGGDVADRAQTEVVDFMSRILTEDASDTIDAVEALFTETNAGALTFGLLAALWAVSRAFSAMIRALDIAYDVEMEDTRSWIRLRATGLVMALATLALTAVLLAMLVLGPLLGTGEDIADTIGAGDLLVTFWTWFRLPVVSLALVAWATTLFHLGPASHKTPWRWDLPGAVATALLAAGATVGMRVYLDFASASNQVFGVLGGALVVLLWFYLLSASLLVGAELNEILSERWNLASRKPDGAAGTTATDPPGSVGQTGSPSTEPAASEVVEPRTKLGDEGAGVGDARTVEQPAHDR